MRTRSLDFVLLSAWWLSLYGYYCVPWLFLKAFPRYEVTLQLVNSARQVVKAADDP